MGGVLNVVVAGHIIVRAKGFIFVGVELSQHNQAGIILLVTLRVILRFICLNIFVINFFSPLWCYFFMFCNPLTRVLSIRRREIMLALNVSDFVGLFVLSPFWQASFFFSRPMPVTIGEVGG